MSVYRTIGPTLVKLRIFDTYKQYWYSEINNSPGLQSYSILKHIFETETYLDVIPEKRYKIYLSRFRNSSHDLRLNLVDTMAYRDTKGSVDHVQ